MDKVYFAKQRILNRDASLFAYELLFRDTQHGIKDFPTNIKATSNVLINVLMNTHEVLEETKVLLVNVDEEFLLSGMIDLLDPNKFLLEILETTDLSEKVISRIKQYHTRGFKIAIDDFDCTLEMIKKFTPIFTYVHLIKIDLVEAELENMNNVVPRLKKMKKKLLAEKVETKEEYEHCLDLGFDLFQGYYLHKPEVMEANRSKDITQVIILKLIQLIQNDASTVEIEKYIKERSELSFKLMTFLNLEGEFDVEIESIRQAITLLGRDRLLRWLLLYLHSEVSDNPTSNTILQISLKRAKAMEEHALPEDKDKAYLAGMFSMIGALFGSTTQEVIKDIKLDKDIVDLLIHRKGKFLSSFLKVELKEQIYFKKLYLENIEKINSVDLLSMFEMNKIYIDMDEL